MNSNDCIDKMIDKRMEGIEWIFRVEEDIVD
jgi:hypothetical protein